MSNKSVFNSGKNYIKSRFETSDDRTSIMGRNISNLISSSIFKLIYFYINQYGLGNIDYLINTLTLDKYTTHSIELYNLRIINDKNYETIRKNLDKTLMVLYRSVSQYKEYIKIQNNCKSIEKKLEILNNIDELKIYLNKLLSNMPILPEISVTAPEYSIKPQFLKYIQLHGYPKNGIFDPEKLAEIIITYKL